MMKHLMSIRSLKMAFTQTLLEFIELRDDIEIISNKINVLFYC